MTTYYNYAGAVVALSAQPQTMVYGTSAANETLYAAPGPSGLSSEGGADDTLVDTVNGDVTFYAKDPTDIVQVAAGLAGVKTIVAYTAYVLPDNVQNLQYAGGDSWGIGNALGNLIVMTGNDNTFLDGGAGNDVLVGGFGKNNFQAAVGNGSDVIYGFHASQDTVRLPGASFTTFAQVQHAMTQVGPDVVLKIDPTETLTFRDTTIASFRPANFLMPVDWSQIGALTFDDEFNSLQTFDFSTGTGHWRTNLGGSPNNVSTYQIDGNNEHEVYTDAGFRGTADHDLGYDPYSIDSGVLSITAQKFSTADSYYAWGQAYSSGMLTTKGIFMQQYGYFEMRAELPTALGSWPAFWLSQDPYTGQAEADIMEHLALQPSVDFVRAYGDTFNSLSEYLEDPTGFHTYGMMWTPTATTFYIDGMATMQVATPSSWDKPMYMILDMAIGGWGGPIDDAAYPASLNIDYVRVYGLADNSQIVQNLTPAGPAGTLTASGAAVALDNSADWTDVRMLANGQIVMTSSVDSGFGSHAGQAMLYDAISGAQEGSNISLYGFAGQGQTMDPVITTMAGSFWRVDYAGADAPAGWEVHDSAGQGVFFQNQYTDGNSGFTPLASGDAVITNSAHSTFAVLDTEGVWHVHDLPEATGAPTQPSEVHALSNGGFFFTYAGQSRIDVFNDDGSVDMRGALGAPVSEFAMASDAMTSGQFAVAWLAPPSDGGFNMGLTFQTFDAAGQALAQSQTVAVDADPWHTELKVLATGKPGEALLLWSQGGAIHAAFAHGSTIDPQTTLMVGSLDQTTQTALTDGNFLLTWMQNDNGVQDLWSESFNPYTMQGTIEGLGPADGGVRVVPLAHGAYAVSWHSGSNVEARAYDGEGNVGPITQVAGDFVGADADNQVVSIYHGADGAALLQHYAMIDYFSV